MNPFCRLRRRLADDKAMAGIAACLMIIVVLAGATLIFDGGRALTAKREIINVAEAAARAGVATADVSGLNEQEAEAAARAHIAKAGIADANIVTVDATRTRVTVTLQARRSGVFTSLLGNSTITVTGTGTAVWNYGGNGGSSP